MAEELYEYFASVFMVEDTTSIPLIPNNVSDELNTIAITGEIALCSAWS